LQFEEYLLARINAATFAVLPNLLESDDSITSDVEQKAVVTTFEIDAGHSREILLSVKHNFIEDDGSARSRT